VGRQLDWVFLVGYPLPVEKGGLMNRVHFSSATDEWGTPESFYKKLNQEFNFDFDPCPLGGKVNGLLLPWGNRTFVNPPYSDIKSWMKKGYEESLEGNLIVFLIPSRTDTKWWHQYVMKATEIRFIQGRLHFNNHKNPAPFPSCVAIFDGRLK
jgi:site-specific DNA-methyltransferase (adenine-specific)